MSDTDLADLLGLTDDPNKDKIIAALTPEQRAAYENLGDAEAAIKLWQAGKGPKPEGMILCGEHED